MFYKFSDFLVWCSDVTDKTLRVPWARRTFLAGGWRIGKEKREIWDSQRDVEAAAVRSENTRRFPTSRRTRTPSYSRKVPLAVSTTQHRVKLNKTWIFGDETHHRYLAGMSTCTLQRDFKIILACSDEGNRRDASACRFSFTRTVW